MSTSHPSAQFLPAGEIDRRILEETGKVKETVTHEFRDSMKSIENKVDQMAEQLTLLVGTRETKGVLTRMEESLNTVIENQDNNGKIWDDRIRQDDKFRDNTLREFKELKSDVNILKKEMATFKMLVALSSALIKTGKKISESSWAMTAIIALLTSIFGIQFIHTVIPEIMKIVQHIRSLF